MEMIRAAVDTVASMTCDLASSIVRDGKIPSDWEQSFIVSLYKGKGDALDGQLPWSQIDRTSHEGNGETYYVSDNTQLSEKKKLGHRHDLCKWLFFQGILHN